MSLPSINENQHKMKQYLLLFLLMMSSVCYAPNLPKLPEGPRLTEGEMAIIRERQLIDSLDISYISSLKIRETNKFTKEERQKVRQIAKELNIKKTKWLYKIFYIESRLNPKAVNKYSNATGLIGFLPSTAVICGTTTKELYNMTVIEQLDYVKIYFELALNGKKVNNFLDLYLAVFSPNAIGRADSYIIGHKNSNIVLQNKGFMNKQDSTITKKDIRLAVMDALL